MKEFANFFAFRMYYANFSNKRNLALKLLMPYLILHLIASMLVFSQTALATTWDEPWHEDVVAQSESFVLVRILENDSETGVKALVIRHIAGYQTPDTLIISGYYLLEVLSTMTGEVLRARVEVDEEHYMYLKSSKEGGVYEIATPTAGFALRNEGSVYATYRHSYHQAQVPQEVYERTMTILFNHLHDRPFDQEYIDRFIREQLSKPPAGLDSEEEAELFFLQHVALESFYHVGRNEDFALLLPFLRFHAAHVQISAVRALSRIDTRQSKEEILGFLQGEGDDFAKVICVWALKRLNARELIGHMEEFLAIASSEEVGFGGNIMDPRVGTSFPRSVKASVQALLDEWSE